MAKFATNANGAILLPSSIQVTESISGSVVPLAMFICIVIVIVFEYLDLGFVIRVVLVVISQLLWSAPDEGLFCISICISICICVFGFIFRFCVGCCESVFVECS